MPLAKVTREIISRAYDTFDNGSKRDSIKLLLDEYDNVPPRDRTFYKEVIMNYYDASPRI